MKPIYLLLNSAREVVFVANSKKLAIHIMEKFPEDRLGFVQKLPQQVENLKEVITLVGSKKVKERLASGEFNDLINR